MEVKLKFNFIWFNFQAFDLLTFWVANKITAMSADREKHRETLNQHLIQQINITIYQPWHHETWICSQNLNPNLSGCMNCKFQVVCHIKQPSGKSVISSSFLFAHMTLNNTDTTADWLTLTRSWVKGNTVMFWFCCSSFCRRTSKKNNLSTFRLNIHSLTYQGNVQNMYLLHVLCVHIACERLYAEKGDRSVQGSAVAFDF